MTPFDVVVLLIVSAAFLYALLKGATAMVLTLFAWLGAMLVTLYGTPYAMEFARGLIQPDMFADITAVLLLFFVGIVVFKIIAEQVGRRVRTSAVGFLDRSLGAAIGLALGVVIVSAGYLLFSGIVAEKNHPDWVKEARSRPLVAYGASVVATVGPGLFEHMEETPDGKELLDKMRAAQDTGTARLKDAADAGYQELQRRMMDEKLEELMRDREAGETAGKKDGGGD